MAGDREDEEQRASVKAARQGSVEGRASRAEAGSAAPAPAWWWLRTRGTVSGEASRLPPVVVAADPGAEPGAGGQTEERCAAAKEAAGSVERRTTRRAAFPGSGVLLQDPCGVLMSKNSVRGPQAGPFLGTPAAAAGPHLQSAGGSLPLLATALPLWAGPKPVPGHCEGLQEQERPVSAAAGAAAGAAGTRAAATASAAAAAGAGSSA